MYYPTMSIFRRGTKLYAKIKDVSGKWQQVATGFAVGEEDAARRWLDGQRHQVEAAIAAGATTGPLTVAGYAKPWLQERRDLGLDWTNDETRLRLHVLPVIGHVPIANIHASHLVALVMGLRKAGGHGPRTIRNIYSVIAALLRDAELAGLIDRAPTKLTSYQLGPVHDVDPERRGDAVFTAPEVEQLISSPVVPPDRRVVYALGALAGLRHGEIAGLRWHRYETAREPLGMLVIATSYNKGRTKTGAVRRMPVHPELAAVLGRWWLAGWAQLIGRAPTPDDLIVPLEHDAPKKQARANPRAGGMRNKNDSRKRWLLDLAELGLRHRRGHDLRATFITLAEEGGADPAIISRLTHTGVGRDAYAGYSRPQWETYCREVAKLQIRQPEACDPDPSSTECTKNPGDAWCN